MSTVVAVAFFAGSIGLIVGWLMAVRTGRRRQWVDPEDRQTIYRIMDKVDNIEKEQ